jgi:hypothetical protein
VLYLTTHSTAEAMYDVAMRLMLEVFVVITHICWTVCMRGAATHRITWPSACVCNLLHSRRELHALATKLPALDRYCRNASRSSKTSKARDIKSLWKVTLVVKICVNADEHNFYCWYTNLRAMKFIQIRRPYEPQPASCYYSKISFIRLFFIRELFIEAVQILM